MMFSNLGHKTLPLSKFEYPISEKNGVTDEGLIDYIFTVIEPSTKFCIEFGAGNGSDFLGVRDLLLNKHFGGLLIEGSPNLAAQLRATYADRDDVKTIESFITKDNIEEIFSSNGVPSQPDFLMIDIDGNDYHIWESITNYEPKVVCIEYNASYGPDEDFVVEYDPDLSWQHDDYHSASIKKMVELGTSKGYSLLHVKMVGDNLYFVKDEYLSLFNIGDNSIQAMYQLPQMGKYGRGVNGKGHPASSRNTTSWQRTRYKIRYYWMSLPRKFARASLRAAEKSNLQNAKKPV